MKTTVLKGGRLIDGSGKGPVAETAIVICGAHIALLTRGGKIVKNRLEPVPPTLLALRCG